MLQTPITRSQLLQRGVVPVSKTVSHLVILDNERRALLHFTTSVLALNG